MVAKEIKALQPDPSGSDLRSALAIAVWTVNTKSRRGLSYTPYEIQTGRVVNYGQFPELSFDEENSLSNVMRRRYNQIKSISKYMEERNKELLDRKRSEAHQKLAEEQANKFQKNDIIKIINPRKPGQAKRLWYSWTDDNYRILSILPFANSALVERITNCETYRPRRLRVHYRQMKLVKRRNIDDKSDHQVHREEDNTQTNSEVQEKDEKEEKAAKEAYKTNISRKSI